MDKYVIKLLFDYRGKINHQEFRQGIILLFALVVWDRFLFVIHVIPNIIIGRLGVLELVQIKAFEFYSIPSLPIVFVLFISSLVLVRKRFNEISNNRLLGLLLGLIVFLFFHTISISTGSNQIFYGTTDLDIPDSSRLFYQLSFGLSIVLGIAIIIYLANVKKTGNIERTMNNVDIPVFISSIGKLLVSFFIVIGVICFISIFYANWQFISIVLAIIFVVYIVLYFRIAIKRSKDAGIGKVIVLWGLGVTIIVCCVSLILQLKTSNLIIHQVVGFVVSLIIILFELGNLMLFLLPSKNNNI